MSLFDVSNPEPCVDCAGEKAYYGSARRRVRLCLPCWAKDNRP